MVIKPRSVPTSIQVRRNLLPRMTFTDEELKQLHNDEKGYEGECYFDSLIAGSPASTYLQLNDLLLMWHNKTFQIDSLLISPHKIFLFDIKNFLGEFYIDGERWFMSSGYEVQNPIPQLQRCESLLRPLLQSIGINLPIESNIIFVNPEFTLFQASRNLPIILPTQIKVFINKLGSISVKPSELIVTQAKKLVSLHDENSPYYRKHIPVYTYESGKKGLSCFRCGSLSVHLDGRNLVCDTCGEIENLHDGILRMVQIFHLLYPERIITVPSIMEWCGQAIKRLRMQKILKYNFEMVKDGKKTFYRML